MATYRLGFYWYRPRNEDVPYYPVEVYDGADDIRWIRGLRPKDRSGEIRKPVDVPYASYHDGDWIPMSNPNGPPYIESPIATSVHSSPDYVTRVEYNKRQVGFAFMLCAKHL